MRDYAKVSPQFWVWARQNRLTQEEMLTCLYLVTSPSANMFGVYYLVVEELAHFIGSPFEGASKALRRVCEKDFARFDEASGMVWIRNMAGWQVLSDWEPLKPNDNRVK